MKIDKINGVLNQYKNINFGGSKDVPQEQIKADASCLECLDSSGRILVGKTPKQMLKEAEETVAKTLSGNETIKKRTYIDSKGNGHVIFVQIGEPIEGFPDLFDDKKRAAVHFDKTGKLEKAFVMDKKTREINVYDGDGVKTHHFTKEERDALYYYKYHPDAIHFKLRSARNMYSGSFMEEAENAVNMLESIFNNPNKIFRTEKNLTLYRGLQSDLSEDDIEALNTVGAVYKDKSFCSTTTNLNVAKAFSGGISPILEISFPKNSKYVDIEGLFNIDHRHWSEDELLLNKGSKFLITGYNPEKNTIKCDYIGE